MQADAPGGDLQQLVQRRLQGRAILLLRARQLLAQRRPLGGVGTSDSRCTLLTRLESQAVMRPTTLLSLLIQKALRRSTKPACSQI